MNAGIYILVLYIHVRICAVYIYTVQYINIYLYISQVLTIPCTASHCAQLVVNTYRLYSCRSVLALTIQS